MFERKQYKHLSSAKNKFMKRTYTAIEKALNYLKKKQRFSILNL